MATPQQIVRCLKSDIGNILAAIRYAEGIAANSRLNPWAEPDAAANYSEAARILRAETSLSSVLAETGAHWEPVGKDGALAVYPTIGHRACFYSLSDYSVSSASFTHLILCPL